MIGRKMSVRNGLVLLVGCALCAISFVGSFTLFATPPRMSKNCDLVMKWMFGKGAGSMVDLGGIGVQGEYYYIPSKRPNLNAPAEAIGNERNIPIFPRNQVLGPLGEEYLGVYEMRYRQLLNDIGDGGVFGHLYYSQENSKLALVGTLARVVKKERLDDGIVLLDHSQLTNTHLFSLRWAVCGHGRYRQVLHQRSSCREALSKSKSTSF